MQGEHGSRDTNASSRIPKLPFPQGDPQRCHPQPKPAHPHQHEASQISIRAWLQPGERSQCCLGLPPALLHPQHLVLGWQDSSGMHRVPREMKVTPVLAPKAHVLFS